MTTTVNGGLSRVTIVAPRTRMDLALPSDIPLADMLPTLLRHAGEELADEGAARGGWALTRLGGRPLDTSRTPLQLEIRDGELLHFVPRQAAAPEVVFDDVVDAVATATQDRGDRWQLANTRRFALLFSAAALLGGAAATLFAGPPHLPGALVASTLALGLLLSATVLSRALGNRPASRLLALVGLAYAGVGGLLMLAGDREVTALGAPQLLLAGTVLLIYGAAATVAVGEAPLFLGAAASGLALSLGASICLIFGAPPAAAAAGVAALAFAIVPALPMFAYRLARLPIPSIPTDPGDLKNDSFAVDGRRILARSELAATFLTGLVATISVIIVGAEVVLAKDGQLNSLLFGGMLAVLLLLRARPFLTQAQRWPVLIAGMLGLGLTAVSAFLAGDGLLRFGAVLGTLVVAALVSLGYGLAVASKQISPVWGRSLDIIEILLIVAVVPLAAWVCGLYGWISTIQP
ncbi:MAG TPA: type VII secretion integral membrane protein EccD [Micromonosporaceae bacterium]|nr:type VII secretion integral membrane protein EccD [Micromonosporaceae bacterium]